MKVLCIALLAFTAVTLVRISNQLHDLQVRLMFANCLTEASFGVACKEARR